MGVRGELFSVRANTQNRRRTYFFNVKENRKSDLFLTIVESKHSDDGDTFERRQIIVFEEDIDSFVEGMEKIQKFLHEHQQGKPVSTDENA